MNSPDLPASSNESPAPAVAQDADARWRLTEELFNRALDCPPAQRAESLAQWCGNDSALLETVLALIVADNSVEELIAAAPAVEPGEFLQRDLSAGETEVEEIANDDDLWIGRVLGAFRLERLLGRGGMGVVYLGQRISGGFSQTVAIKLVGRHLRSSPAVAQFLLERETLARLEHANIARLLDGGVTSEGFPYVVMEYVEGRRLDAACDDPSTTIQQIIRWILELCEAVTYVHRNLILHRDLKPGNVMVTTDGHIKLLDFGTLKRIGPGGDNDSSMTRVGMRSVTLRYASPEHIEGESVSTATDVYSLGMILYRVVAGRLPDGFEDLPIGQYLQRLKLVRIKPPSQVANHLPTAGKRTGMYPHIARDLDAIIAKALRYEPQSRYPTASALAEDLWNLLLHRPVTAHQESLTYRAEKFYRRNQWPILASAAALLVLAIGLSAMGWQGHVAHIQELRAETGVEDERQLAHMLLFDYFEKLSLIPGSIDAQRKAVTRALAYLDSLSQIAPGSNLDLDIIGGYTDMGNLLGNSYKQNLGDFPGAILAFNKAIAMARERVRLNPRDLQSRFALLSTEHALGATYLGNGDAAHAETILLPAADLANEISHDPQATSPMLETAAAVTDILGDVYDPDRGYATADMDKAMQTYQLSANYDLLCQQKDPANDLCGTGIVVSEYKFGSLVEDTDPALAAAHFKEGLAVVARFSTELKKTTRAHRLKHYMESRLALMYLRTAHGSEGVAMAKDAQAGFHESIARSELDNRARFDLVAFETDLAVDYHRTGNEQQASDTAADALDSLAILLQRSPNNTRWQMIEAQNRITYGRAQLTLGHKADGSEAIRKGLEQAVHLAETKDASPQQLGVAADALLEFHLHSQDAQTALAFARKAVSTYARPTPAQLLTLAKAQSAAGQSKEAEKTAHLVLTALAGPVKSEIVAGQIADARLIAR